MDSRRLNHLTYADAIADVKSWIEHELNANTEVVMKTINYNTRAFIKGRINELHAMDGACDALLYLARLEEENGCISPQTD